MGQRPHWNRPVVCSHASKLIASDERRTCAKIARSQCRHQSRRPCADNNNVHHLLPSRNSRAQRPSTNSGNTKLSPNRTVYIGEIPASWRYAIHSPEVQVSSICPCSIQIFPTPRLTGIVVGVPRLQCTFQTESVDLMYHPFPRRYERPGWKNIVFCGSAPGRVYANEIGF